jgi:hypothetical protein
MKSLPIGRGVIHRTPSAFTLVELTVAMALLAFLMIILANMTDSASRAWCQGQSRAVTFQTARASLDLLARELAPAVVDTRMQFVVAPASILAPSLISPENIAADSPVLLWMAPRGNEGGLCCVGYYLYRDDTNKFYRLKRLYIPATDANGHASAYFPQTTDFNSPRDAALQPSPTDASWFTRNWTSNASSNPFDDPNAVSSAADGVIAFWVQCIDLLGNPIPLVSGSSVHPASSLYFNSAAYFQVATTSPFDNGSSFTYLAQTALSLRANRVPAAIDLTIVLLDSATIARTVSLPEQSSKGGLSVAESLNNLNSALNKIGIHNARTFSTRVKLINGN